MRSVAWTALVLGAAAVGAAAAALRVPDTVQHPDAFPSTAQGDSEGPSRALVPMTSAKAALRAEGEAGNLVSFNESSSEISLLEVGFVDMLGDAIPSAVKFLFSKSFSFLFDEFSKGIPSSSKRVIKKGLTTLSKTGFIATFNAASVNPVGLAYSLTRLIGDIGDLAGLIQRVSVTKKLSETGHEVCKLVGKKKWIRRLLQDSVEAERDRELFARDRAEFFKQQEEKATREAMHSTVTYLTKKERAVLEAELVEISSQIKGVIAQNDAESLAYRIVSFMDIACKKVEAWKNAIKRALGANPGADQITNAELKTEALASMSERAEKVSGARFRWDRTETQVIMFAEVTLEVNGVLEPPTVTMVHMQPSWKSDDPSVILWPRGIRILTSADSLKCWIRDHQSLQSFKQVVGVEDVEEEEEQFCLQEMAMVLNPLVGGIWKHSFLKRDTLVGLEEPTFTMKMKLARRGYLMTIVPEFELHGTMPELLRGLAAGDAPVTPPDRDTDDAAPAEAPKYCVSVYGTLKANPMSKGKTKRGFLKAKRLLTALPTSDPILYAFDRVYSPGEGNTHTRICTDNYAQAIVLFCTASNIAISSPTLPERTLTRHLLRDHGRVFIVHSLNRNGKAFDPSAPLYEQLEHGSYYKYTNSMPKVGLHVVGLLCSAAATEFSDTYASHVREGIDMTKTGFIDFSSQHMMGALDTEIKSLLTGSEESLPTNMVVDGDRKMFRAALSMVAEQSVREGILQGAAEMGVPSSPSPAAAPPGAAARCEALFQSIMGDPLEPSPVVEEIPVGDDKQTEGESDEMLMACSDLTKMSETAIKSALGKPATEGASALDKSSLPCATDDDEVSNLKTYEYRNKMNPMVQYMATMPAESTSSTKASSDAATAAETGTGLVGQQKAGNKKRSLLSGMTASARAVFKGTAKPKETAGATETTNPLFMAREEQLKRSFIAACTAISPDEVNMAMELRSADGSSMPTKDDFKRLKEENVEEKGELVGEVDTIKPPAQMAQRAESEKRIARNAGAYVLART